MGVGLSNLRLHFVYRPTRPTPYFFTSFSTGCLLNIILDFVYRPLTSPCVSSYAFLAAASPTLHLGSRKSPEVENPRAVYTDWETMRDKAQWDAVVAGKKPVGNRSPVASEVRRHRLAIWGCSWVLCIFALVCFAVLDVLHVSFCCCRVFSWARRAYCCCLPWSVVPGNAKPSECAAA